MECTLATLVACFSWSGLFVDTGVQLQDRGTAVHYRTDTPQLVGHEWVWNTQWRTVDKPDNPYGRFGVGYVVDFGSAQLTLEANHTSSMQTGGDKGINAVSLSLRWFPFR